MHTERYITYVNLFNNNLSRNIYKFILEKYYSVYRKIKILLILFIQYKFTFTLHSINIQHFCDNHLALQYLRKLLSQYF